MAGVKMASSPTWQALPCQNQKCRLGWEEGPQNIRVMWFFLLFSIKNKNLHLQELESCPGLCTIAELLVCSALGGSRLPETHSGSPFCWPEAPWGPGCFCGPGIQTTEELCGLTEVTWRAASWSKPAHSSFVMAKFVCWLFY